VISEEAMSESLDALEESLGEVCAGGSGGTP